MHAKIYADAKNYQQKLILNGQSLQAQNWVLQQLLKVFKSVAYLSIRYIFCSRNFEKLFADFRIIRQITAKLKIGGIVMLRALNTTR